MARDNRRVHTAVRIGAGSERRRITDVDELQEALTPELHSRLQEAGATSGDWGFTTEAEDGEGGETSTAPRSRGGRRRRTVSVPAGADKSDETAE